MLASVATSSEVCRLRFMLRTGQSHPSRFDAALSNDARCFATSDLDVSEDRTHTGKPP
jgi:hypothetical protein